MADHSQIRSEKWYYAKFKSNRCGSNFLGVYLGSGAKAVYAMTVDFFRGPF